METCLRCSTKFIPKKGKAKFCSDNCRGLYRYHVVLPELTCNCSRCGKEFNSKTRNKYCSRECQYNNGIRTCLNIKCGKSYKASTYNQKYCCVDCKPYKAESEPFYQSYEWRLIRAKFVSEFTTVMGLQLSNNFCIECYLKNKEFVKMFAVDHIIRRKDGGSDDSDNLQSLCRKHHQSKSATEGNKQYYAKTRI